MKYAVLDVETSIYANGHPFSACNKLCMVGIRINGVNSLFKIEYDEEPYGEKLERIRNLVCGDAIDYIVGYNLKFDLNWLARYGIVLPPTTSVFDCQLAEFILAAQSPVFPSLDYCLAKYGLGSKSDVILREYWSKGIDTPQVPLEELSAYLREDLRLTDELFQTTTILVERSGLGNLVRLHMQDLRVLQEMEFNGICLDWASMDATRKQVEEELNDINRQILLYCPEDARGWFNTGSNDHISALLYGGTINGKQSTPYEHTFTSGQRVGETVWRNRWQNFQCIFPRLVDPQDGTELKKEGFWSTGADILKQLPKPKALLSLLLKQAELSKLLDTYLVGFPKKAKEMDWQDGCIHSTLNQTVAITGRLSSSKPNQQNLPEVFNEFIITRFERTNTR